jgi:hypothetical protein
MRWALTIAVFIIVGIVNPVLRPFAWGLAGLDVVFSMVLLLRWNSRRTQKRSRPLR